MDAKSPEISQSAVFWFFDILENNGANVYHLLSIQKRFMVSESCQKLGVI